MNNDITKQGFLDAFGKRIDEIRKEKNLTYRKIAENCDLDNSYISKIAKGQANITLETILELMKGLEIQPKELFDFKIEL